MEKFKTKEKYDFNDLCKIMELLRSENGCPWDREQTHRSIRNNFLEEAYEAVEGIDKNDPKILKEELGDVLLQVVFHSQIEYENGNFGINDVADGICKKLILRHPHIFSDTKAENSQKVLENWDKIKREEKGQASITDSLNGISRSLPSLMRSYKILSKISKTPFWNLDIESAEKKIKTITESISKDNAEDAVGEMLFLVSYLAKYYGVNPEEALFLKNDEVINSFESFEGKEM